MQLPWHDPEQVFLSLFANKKYTFWLDNNKTENNKNHYSYMGWVDGKLNKKIKYTISNHTLTITKNNKTKKLRKNIFDYLKEELAKWQGIATDLPCDFIGGFVGYLGYEMQTECATQVPLKYDVKQFYKAQFPDAYFFFIDKFLAFDHKNKYLYLVTLSKNKEEASHWLSATKNLLSNQSSPSPLKKSWLPEGRRQKEVLYSKELTFTLTRNHQQYLKDIRTCQKYLIRGDAYQICLTNQITAKIKTNWLELFRVLRKTNPAPFSAYMNFGDFALLSSSPEQFLKISRKGDVIAKPMKGTVKRGKTPKEDKQLAQNLGQTKKDYAENIMIVDLVRNDLGKVCVIGSVKVTMPLAVETYATVHQLVSTITGKLRTGVTAIDLIQACFPGGSMTGAPKLRTMKIISEIEKEPRGIYSGTFGFLSLNGTANFAMTIRTIIATKNKLSFGTGGAILTDSIPQKEYNEIILKAEALMRTIAKTTEAKNYKITNST